MQRRENKAAYEAVEADSFFRKGCGSYWRLIFFTPFFLSVGVIRPLLEIALPPLSPSSPLSIISIPHSCGGHARCSASGSQLGGGRRCAGREEQE
jgi:hypothetical protein